MPTATARTAGPSPRLRIRISPDAATAHRTRSLGEGCAIQGLVNTRQLFLIIVLTRIAVMADGLPVVTVGSALQDAWLGALLATAASAALAALAATLAMRFPGKSLGVFARETLGRWLGLGVSLAVALVYFLLTLFELYQLTTLTKGTILPRTPAWVFTLSVLSVAVYGAYLGADAMGRAAEVLITIVFGAVVVGVCVLVAAPLPQSYSSLSPVLERGVWPVAEAAIIPALWFLVSGGTVLGLGKFTRPTQKLRGAVVGAVLASGMLLTLFAVISTLILGPSEARDQLAPMLSVARAINLPGILERSDLLLIVIWLLGAVFETTIFLLVAAIVSADALGLNVTQVVPILGAAAALVVVLYTPTVFDLRRAAQPTPTGLGGLFALGGVVALMLVVTALRGAGRRGRGGP
ncbi:MAG: GerAB/ArcD/ProY family transporter [Bacillota bacterium]